MCILNSSNESQQLVKIKSLKLLKTPNKRVTNLSGWNKWKPTIPDMSN